MTLATFEDTPNLAIHKYPSAALANIMRRNLLALDSVTRQGRVAFAGGFEVASELIGLNPYREWWGGYRSLPGITTLWITTNCTGIDTGDKLRVVINGAVAGEVTLANGLATNSIALNPQPLNSVPDVRFEVYNNAKPLGNEGVEWGNIEVVDAWVGPIGLADAYPGEPTFAASFNAEDIAKLANCVDWLVRRVGRRTEPLFQSIIRWRGPYGPTGDEPGGQTTVRWRGGVEVTSAAPTLVARGRVNVEVAGATEVVRLIVNGAVVDSYNVPSTIGDHAYQLTYTLPHATGTKLPIVVDMRRTGSPAYVGAEPVNRFTLNWVGLVGAANIYSAINIPTVVPRTLGTWSNARTFLNACAQACATIKARIDANPDLWSRQRLFTRRFADPGRDEWEDRVFEPGMIAASPARRGEALLVRGKGNQIVWGPQEFDSKPDQAVDGVGLYPLRPIGPTMTICQGTELQTELVYLDDCDGLYGAAPYNVRGEQLSYAGEILLVGTDVS